MLVARDDDPRPPAGRRGLGPPECVELPATATRPLRGAAGRPARAPPDAGRGACPRRRARRRADPRCGRAGGRATGGRDAARARCRPCGRRVQNASSVGSSTWWRVESGASSGPSWWSTNVVSAGRLAQVVQQVGHARPRRRRTRGARATRWRRRPTANAAQARAGAPASVSAGAPIASAASSGRRPAPLEHAVESPATCSGERRVVAGARRARPARARRPSRGPNSTAKPVEDRRRAARPDSRVHDSSSPRRERGPRQLAATGSSTPRAVAREAQRLGAAACVRLLDAPVGEVGQERPARARAQVLLVLLAEQVDRHRQRGALGGDAIEVVERLVDGRARSGGRGRRRPSRTSTISAPSGSRRSAACSPRPRSRRRRRRGGGRRRRARGWRPRARPGW